uniref:Uncharacterized protein n=1 Tax=viral metagenome TaxID=1070528 RepID=A0A6M3KTX0_9ZZZZ
MGFTIVHPNQLQVVDMPVLAADIIYTGSIVSDCVTTAATPLEGVSPIGAARGAADTTNKTIPYGVVIGNNNVSGNIQSSSTYKTEYITQVATSGVWGSTTQYEGVEGPWVKGDKQAMVKVALIGPETILRGNIYNAAVGTAPTLLTATTGCGGDGIGMTTNALGIANVANFGTVYMRTGANAGIYRTTTSTSQTAHTWLMGMPGTIEIGDTAIITPGLRTHGHCRMQLDAEALYINVGAALTSYYSIVVVRLDLSEAGKEYVEFRFGGDHFSAMRT